MALSNGGFEAKLIQSEERGLGLGLGLGFVRFTRGLGRKRILISNSVSVNRSKEVTEETISSSDQAPLATDSPPVKLKKQRSVTMEEKESHKSIIESLHQDLLIKILCGVDHDDLIKLQLVSKSFKSAVIEAKKTHFAYTTPKKTLPFQNPLENSNLSEEIEAPNAPIQRRYRHRESDLSKISVALFK